MLKAIRGFVKSQNLTLARLPKWIENANIQIAKINNSAIILFDESFEKHDKFVSFSSKKSDLQFFFRLSEYTPKNAVLKSGMEREYYFQYRSVVGWN